jgi:hypothetical protein
MIRLVPEWARHYEEFWAAFESEYLLLNSDMRNISSFSII